LPAPSIEKPQGAASTAGGMVDLLMDQMSRPWIIAIQGTPGNV
jgi:hypothetical protein